MNFDIENKNRGDLFRCSILDFYMNWNKIDALAKIY